MNKITKYASLILAIMLVLSLSSCGNDNQNKNELTKEIDDSVNASEVLSVSEGINKDIMLTAVSSIDEIKNNYTIETSYVKTLETSDNSGVYNFSKLNYVTCESTSGESEFNTVLEYKGIDSYPTTLSITYNYKTIDENNKQKEWVYSIVNEMINQETADAFRNCQVGSSIADVAQLENQSLSVSVTEDDLTVENGCFVGTYIVTFKGINNNDDSTEKSDLECINLSENPNCSIFNTSLMDYNETLKSVEDKIASIYGDNHSCKIVNISNADNTSTGKNFGQTSIGFIVTKEEGYNSYWTVNTTKYEDSYNVYVYINGITMADKKSVFYNTEDILKFITGNEIKLESFYDSNEFTVDNIKMKLSDSTDCNIKVVGKVINQNESYRIDLEIKTQWKLGLYYGRLIDVGYLKDIISKLDGNDTIIIVGVGIIVENREGRILIGKRRDNGLWCVPGGSLEINESLIECASRELYEETGIKAKPEDLRLNTVNHIDEPVIKNGREIHIVSVSYIVSKYDDFEFNLDSREFTSYSWFNKEECELLSDKTSYTIVALSNYFKQS